MPEPVTKTLTEETKIWRIEIFCESRETIEIVYHFERVWYEPDGTVFKVDRGAPASRRRLSDVGGLKLSGVSVLEIAGLLEQGGMHFFNEDDAARARGATP